MKTRELVSNVGVKLPQDLVQCWEKMILTFARLEPEEKGSRISRAHVLFRVLEREADYVKGLWESFTQERGKLTKNLLTAKREAVAYTLGFHLANAARFQMVLNRVGAANLESLCQNDEKNSSFELYDVGAGSGAMAQTFLSFIRNHRISTLRSGRIFLLDISAPLLDMAAFGVEYLGGRHEIVKKKGRIEEISLRIEESSTTKIFLLGYIWNEMSKNKAARSLLLDCLKRLAETHQDVLLVVAEPALQDLSRQTMEFRDVICHLGFQPIYPCPAGADCPMLDRTRDWCYGEFAWDRPVIQQKIDRVLGINRFTVGSSAFMFATPHMVQRISNKGQKSTSQQKEIGVVVGKPLRKTRRDGAFDYLVCTESGLIKEAPKKGAVVRLRGEKI